MSVDDKVALIASREWRERGDDVTDVADSLARIDGGKLTSDNKYLCADTGAVGIATSCASSEHQNHVLFTAIQVYANGHDDATAMKDLIASYTKAVERSNTCG
ncbi:hypothetical protein [Streptomyces sp. NPDC049813]|uniref:hypothetical protein n=1 Tax=Streptomyces sp. NPDC049813 TaxID=3365597 RepID=UPI0037BA4B8C